MNTVKTLKVDNPLSIRVLGPNLRDRQSSPTIQDE